MLTHFQHITLTSDQRNTVEKLHAFLLGDDDVFILQGYAGSGKTTLLKGLVEYLKSIKKQFQLMAPTGRAAKVINQKTGMDATTVHKGIYSFKELQEIKKTNDEGNVSFLYQYRIRNNPDVHNSVLIVDEASMVSDVLNEGEFFRFGSGHLLRDLIDYSGIQQSDTTVKIIFVGDPAQLPPIGMNFSPALDPGYLKKEYGLGIAVAEMKEVKRQDTENGVLQSATRIRKSITSGFFNHFNLKENGKDIFNPDFKDFMETYKAQGRQKIIVTYKNKTALGINQKIRRDKFGSDLPIQPSDTVIIGANNYRLGIMNGEFAVVSESDPSVESREISFYLKGGKNSKVRLVWRHVSLVLADTDGNAKIVSGYILENYLYGDNYLKPEEQRALYIDFKNRHPNLKKGSEEFKEALINDEYFNCILLKFGYAVTCHKAQGGEWADVFVFWDRGVRSDFNFLESEQDKSGKTNADFYRWAYTAVTRASEKLFCINPPYFDPFSGMSFIDVNVQEAFDELTGTTTALTELELDAEMTEALKRFRLEDTALTIQDHFIYRWHYLRKHFIDIEDWKRHGYEIHYLFKRDGKSAAVKYWINGKNEFRSDFRKIPSGTSSESLFETVTDILIHSPDIIVKRNNPEGILTKIIFEKEIEEQRPFLKDLYEYLSKELEEDEMIVQIEHLKYRERYTFNKKGRSCVVDFEYNNEGFFGRVLPLKKKCKEPRLIIRIKEIVINLKNQ